VSANPALPRPPRQRRSVESSERVIAAGIELLTEAGYEGFTITEVSRRAKVSVGSIYARFGSKDDLFLVLHDRALVDLERDQRDAFAAAGRDELDDHARIAAAVAAVITVMRENAQLLRVIMLRGALDERVLERGSVSVRALNDAFAAVVLRHTEAVRHPDPSLAADVCFRMLFASLSRRITYGPTHESTHVVSWERLAQEQAALCAAYLLA
jgi:AcrR family transcriptional regulator